MEEARIEKKPKGKAPTKSAESKSATFPVETKVNKYGFIYLDGDILAAWGLSKGEEQGIIIDVTPDGALVIRKA